MPSLNSIFYDFINVAVEAATDDEKPLYGAEIHDTVYEQIKDNHGVRISTPASTLAPHDGVIQDFDAVVILVCFARVKGADKTERLEALDVCDAVTKAVAELFFNDSQMGGKVCDTQVLRHAMDFDSIGSDVFAVSNLPIVVNPSGAIDWTRFNVTYR